ncbi:TIGR04282 family arsenosugar biosynthesis glycosyltransferase [Prescottella agglutinans]|uniref:TIGR04282 family arsenosugar biosynthesis glycosyltransferase n=1 Tax=Prescottella agglutinans TaxID=1644129 RepID=UPI003D997EA8
MKTRLAPTISLDDAAELASASLLDTLDAARRTAVTARVVALTGELSAARHSAEIAAALDDFVVVAQRGDDFARRLVNAHADAAGVAHRPVLQIGMDTPQVTPDLLGDAAATLTRPDVDAVFGPATDGGWWAVGVSTPDMAEVLADITPSRCDTGDRTLRGLVQRGWRVARLPVLSDVDTPADVYRVAGEVAPDSRFRAVARRLRLCGQDDVG